MNEAIVSEAKVNDVPGIRTVQAETWKATYPNPAAGISLEDVEAKVMQMQEGGVERMTKRLIDNPEGSHTWVVKDGEVVVGFVGVQRLDQENKLRALYVLPEYQGKGYGHKLITEAITWLGRDKKISLTVVSYNQGAIDFYKSHGFKEIGPVEGEVGQLPSGKVLPEIQMVLEPITT